MHSGNYGARSRLSLLAAATSATVSLFFPFHMAQAQAQASIFRPSGNWSVGATQLTNTGGPGSMKLPCVVSNEYDNGFVVRFSGGGGDMLAMAIDFRQDVFTQGRKYDAMISLGDDYSKQASATAFTASTLIFNLRPVTGFYDVARKSKIMRISIDSNDLEFSLDALSGSYKHLEACYDGKATPSVKPMVDSSRSAAMSPSRNRPVLVPGVEKIAQTPLPKSFGDIVQGSRGQASAPPQNITAASPPEIQNAAPYSAQNVAQAQPLSPAPMRVSRAQETNDDRALPTNFAAAKMQSVQAVSFGAWKARAGEDMKSVLGRWAQIAGYDLTWQADQNGKVAQDISVDGSFEQAVSQLLAENGATNGVSGHIEDEKGAQPVSVSGAQAWAAPKGANMKSTLEQWGAREGVSIVWKNRSAPNVKMPVNVDGSFETAVQTLLDQYADDSSRPVGQLNRDPDTGKRTLLIDIEKAS